MLVGYENKVGTPVIPGIKDIFSSEKSEAVLEDRVSYNPDTLYVHRYGRMPEPVEGVFFKRFRCYDLSFPKKHCQVQFNQIIKESVSIFHWILFNVILCR